MAGGKITVDGNEYRVLERLGYNHDAGGRVVEVETEDGPKMAVGYPSRGYRFWTTADRVDPLRKAIARGWPDRRRG